MKEDLLTRRLVRGSCGRLLCYLRFGGSNALTRRDWSRIAYMHHDGIMIEEPFVYFIYIETPDTNHGSSSETFLRQYHYLHSNLRPLNKRRAVSLYLIICPAKCSFKVSSFQSNGLSRVGIPPALKFISFTPKLQDLINSW